MFFSIDHKYIQLGLWTPTFTMDDVLAYLNDAASSRGVTTKELLNPFMSLQRRHLCTGCVFPDLAGFPRTPPGTSTCYRGDTSPGSILRASCIAYLPNIPHSASCCVWSFGNTWHSRPSSCYLNYKINLVIVVQKHWWIVLVATYCAPGV